MQPDATTTKMNTNKQINKNEDKKYIRNHVIFNEWKNWKEIISTFYSEETKMIAKAINKGYRLYDHIFHPNDCYLIDQSYFICNEITPTLQSYKNEKNFFRVALDLFKKQGPYSDALLDDDNFEYSCYCFSQNKDVWNNDCFFKLQHLRAHIIAFIWAFFYIKGKQEKKRFYRYYQRLEQVVLSLDYQHLKNFDYQLLNQPFYCPNKKNLLIYLYDRAYFDFATPRELREIPYIFESWKHAREQGGSVTCQSFSDSSIFAPGCLEQLIKCAEDPFDVFLSKFRVKSQMFGFNKMEHDLNITDASIIKLKNLMEVSQASFLDGLKETILDSGAKLFSMFCIAATVSLLSRTIVGLSVNLILKMLHMIYCFICPQEVDTIKVSYAYSQSGNGVSIPFIPAMILNHIICPPKDILAKIWKSGTTDLIMKRIGYLGDMKIDKGMERMLDWIKEVIRKIQMWYGKDILGIHCGVKGLFESEESPVSVWFKEIETLVCQYYNNEFRWTELEFQVVYNLYKRGLGYTKSPEFIKYKYDIWNILRQLTSIMEKFKQRGISNQNIRNPPVTLYIYGGTGVGKSSMTYPLAVEILQEIHKRENSNINLRENWKNMIYMRAPEQEFWDGYENQLVTIFDDFSQQTDSMQNPNLELFEIIRASNCFPYPLHMASLEQKASTVFSSKIIIASSNLQGPQCASLNFPDALKRRFDECVKVEREFTGHTNKFDPSLYKLEMYDISTGISKGHITYHDLVMRCVDDYFSRKNFVSSVENYIDGLFDVCTAVSQAGEVENFEDALEETEEEMLKKSIPKFEEKQSNLLRNFVDKYDPFAVIKYVVDFKIRDKVQDMITEWNDFKVKHSYLYKALTLFGCIGVGLGFLKIVSDFKNFKQAKSISLEEAGGRLPRSVRNESYTPTIVKNAKIESYTPAVPKVAKVEGNIVKSEGVKDINASEILMKVARTNLYKMYESTCGTAIGHVFFLKGKVAIMPKHYLSGLHQSLKNDPEAFVYFDAVLLNRSFEIKIKDLLKTRVEYDSPDEENGPVFSRDLMAVSVKTSIYHADAAPYFVTKKNMCRTDSTEVMLPILINNNLATSDRACMLIRYSQGRSQLSVMETLSVCDTDDVVTRYIRNAYMYSLDTQDTECGAPLIVRNTQIQPGKICGIHIAGMAGTGQGWSTPIYDCDVKNILSKFPENDQITTEKRVELKQYPQEQGKIPHEAEFVRLGVLEKGISQASKSKIVPSPLYGKIQEPLTRPCILNQTNINGEVFRPAEYRLKRLGNVPNAIDECLIQNSKDALIDEIGTVLKEKSDLFNNNCKATYTFEEACIGIDGEQYINSVKRDTSSGYPFVQMENFTRKDIFGKNEVYDLETKQCQYLKQRVATIIENAKNNVQLDHYFIDTLKDERKPIEKAHKTRLFSAGPIDYLIACKMYYNGIVNLLSKTRNFCHISVGTNVYSNDWDTIVRILHNKSKLIIAGDFEGFDASQHQRLLEAANEVLIKLSIKFLNATDEDARVMRVLGSTLVNSLHIYKDEVYQWTHSLASGHYLTAIINSIFVNLAFGCTWQISHKLFTYRTARLFWKTCGIVAYGDDHLVSIPLSKIKKYNQNTMKNLMQQIGLTYTLETKDDISCADYRSIDEVQYLKRKFLFDKNINRYICPLDLSVVLEFPMWNHKCPDPVAQTIVELDKCIEELSLHEKSRWDHWHPKLTECGEMLGHFTTYKDQEETRSVALGNSLYL